MTGKASTITPSRRRTTNNSASAAVTPARTGTKRSTRNTVVTPTSTPRVTKRELLRLREKERKEIAKSAAKRIEISEETLVENNANISREEEREESSLQQEFMEMVKEHGLENMATQAGMMNDKKLEVDDQSEDSVGPRKTTTRHARGKRTTAEAFAAAQGAQGSETVSLTDARSSYEATGLTKAKKRRGQRVPPSDKNNKGLRHFSMKVCQKVEEKQLTSYNEVADELVHEFVTTKSAKGLDQAYDEKNIRRRVYDALNVLMAMDIISKEKKEIRWKGLPSNAKHDLEVLMREKQQRLRNIQKKKSQLEDLLVQHIAFKNLVNRNSSRPSNIEDDTRICLPFIIVSTSSDTVIQCEMSEDRQDIFFNFSEPFEINDDNEVLRRMGMHKARYEELRQLVPEQLIKFLPEEYLNDSPMEGSNKHV